MHKCPNSFKHIVSGTEPPFEYPDLELSRKLARRQVTEDDPIMNAALSASDRALELPEVRNLTPMTINSTIASIVILNTLDLVELQNISSTCKISANANQDT